MSTHAFVRPHSANAFISFVYRPSRSSSHVWMASRIAKANIARIATQSATANRFSLGQVLWCHRFFLCGFVSFVYVHHHHICSASLAIAFGPPNICSNSESDKQLPCRIIDHEMLKHSRRSIVFVSVAPAAFYQTMTNSKEHFVLLCHTYIRNQLLMLLCFWLKKLCERIFLLECWCCVFEYDEETHVMLVSREKIIANRICFSSILRS